jgi:hypothetical protein
VGGKAILPLEVDDVPTPRSTRCKSAFTDLWSRDITDHNASWLLAGSDQRSTHASGCGRLFVRLYKDARVPPSYDDYLEGVVVSIAPTMSGGHNVLLSMENNGVADATVAFDGKTWKLKSVPPNGTVVRFGGAMRAYTKDPFIMVFEPDRIGGLDVESAAGTRPFSQPRSR